MPSCQHWGPVSPTHFKAPWGARCAPCTPQNPRGSRTWPMKSSSEPFAQAPPGPLCAPQPLLDSLRPRLGRDVPPLHPAHPLRGRERPGRPNPTSIPTGLAGNWGGLPPFPLPGISSPSPPLPQGRRRGPPGSRWEANVLCWSPRTAWRGVPAPPASR